jgi:hypothetical protein
LIEGSADGLYRHEFKIAGADNPVRKVEALLALQQHLMEEIEFYTADAARAVMICFLRAPLRKVSELDWSVFGSRKDSDVPLDVEKREAGVAD